jgi:hypothetical protein
MKRTFVIIIALLLAVSLVSPALAQGDYYFAVEKEVVHVYWNADGTMSLDYTWVFVNQPGAHVIDFVDVGMPNYNFYTSTATADVNGVPVSVSESDYAGDGSGFAIVLGGQSIPAGQRATVHVYVGQVTKVLYPDTDDETYASAVFAPTYFGSQYVTGSTDLTVTFHLPPGVGTLTAMGASSTRGIRRMRTCSASTNLARPSQKLTCPPKRSSQRPLSIFSA